MRREKSGELYSFQKGGGTVGTAERIGVSSDPEAVSGQLTA